MTAKMARPGDRGLCPKCGKEMVEGIGRYDHMRLMHDIWEDYIFPNELDWDNAEVREGRKIMASVVSGEVTIGGTVFGAVEVQNLVLSDGTKWNFKGYYADCGAGVGICDSPTGDFPGESHMAGSCFMSVIQVPGGFGLSFDDFHGHIGTLGGVFKGAIIELGVGGGSWEQASEEEVVPIEEGGSLSLEFNHIFESAKSGE